MIWGEPNFCPKTKLMKLNLAQKINWLPAFKKKMCTSKNLK